jgi:hypothetical protein
VFDGNDDAYKAWLVANPDGYVVNTRRNFRPAYMVLHTARCGAVQNYTGVMRKGAFTERTYVKVCARDVNDLRNWVRLHGRRNGEFSKRCERCARA